MIRACAAILLLGTAVPALGAAAVIGNGRARGCFEAASKQGSGQGSGHGDERLCDRALADDQLRPDDRVATLVNRGIVRMSARHYAAAIADFDAAIKASPESAEAHVNKGIALVRIGNRDDEAVAELSAGIARNPARPEIAYYSRAIAWEGLGRNREAYEDYSRAAQLAPEWSEPATQLQRFTTIRRPTARG